MRPPGKGKDKNNDGSQCFAFIAKGAKWKNTEPYLVDPTNTQGLDTATILSLTATSLETWDTEVGFNIFGDEVSGIVDGIDTVSPDGKNEVLFGDVSPQGAIAVTIVWYTIGKPSLSPDFPDTRELRLAFP